jgi:signal transduction histidine kinase
VSRTSRPRTTTSRLAVRFGAALLLATFLPFLIIYLQISVVLTRRIDVYLEQEAARMTAPERRALLDELRGRDPTDLHRISLAGLFDRRGVPLAGNLQSLPAGLVADGRVHEVNALVGPDGRRERVRAVVRRLADGVVFVIGGTTWALTEMRATLLYAVLLWVVPLVALSFGGGLLLVLRADRRIRAMHQTTRRIMRGDMRERLRVGPAGDDVDALAGSINSMLEEIEHLMAQLRGLGNNIAHDIRTPLARMKARLDGCRAYCTDDAVCRALDECAIDISQGLRIVTALLRLAEIDAERRREAFRPVRLDALVEEICNLYRPLAEAQGVTLAAGAERLAVQGDGDLVNEALANLVDNAIKFTPPGGHVRIDVARRAGRTVLRVADTGIGLAEGERALVTQRFYRSERNQEVPGVGLGLAIIDAIVRLHGATLQIGENHPGAVFEIAFPDDLDEPGIGAVAST